MGVARILSRGQPDNFYSWQLTPKHALRLTPGRSVRCGRQPAWCMSPIFWLSNSHPSHVRFPNAATDTFISETECSDTNASSSRRFRGQFRLLSHQGEITHSVN